MKPAGERAGDVSLRRLCAWLWTSASGSRSAVLASAGARIVDQTLGIALFVVPAVFLMNQFGYAQDCNCALQTRFSLAGLVGVMLLLALCKGLARYLEQYWGHLAAFRSLEILRGYAFRRIYPQAPAIYAQTHSGKLLANLTQDIDSIEVFFAHTLAPGISALVMPILVVVFTSWIAPWQMSLAVVAVQLVVVFIIVLGASANDLATALSLKQRGILHTQISDIVYGRTEIRGYGSEELFIEKVHQTGQQLVQIQGSIHRKSACRQALLQTWRVASLLVMLGVGGSLYATDSLRLSAWIAVIFAVLRGWEVFRAVAAFPTQLTKSLQAARRVYGITHAGVFLPEGNLECPNESRYTPASLRFQGVCFSYTPSDDSESEGKTTPTLSHIDLEIPAKSWVSLVGVSGSGKSTLGKLILRFFDPESGKITLDRHDLREYRLANLREQVALVSDETTVLNLSVADNLRLACPQASEAMMWRSLEIAGLDTEIRQLRDGLQSNLTSRGTSLSGGQRQRLSLAQALLRRPRVLILDEFAAQLPPSLASQLRQNLQVIRGETTVLEITHNLQQLQFSDLIVTLDEGRIVEMQGAEMRGS